MIERIELLGETADWLKKEITEIKKADKELDVKDVRKKANLQKRKASLIAKCKTELRFSDILVDDVIESD